MDPCICLIKNNFLGVSKDEYLVTIDHSTFIKRNDDKSKLQGSHESVAADARNKSTLKPMMWSSPLLGVGK